MVPRKEVWIMLQYYMTDNGRLQEIDAAKDGCWISMVAPVEKELEYICRQYDLPDDVLKAALDTDERSRIEVDDNYTMVLVNIPTVEEQSDRELYSTIPMAILIVQDAMITVCSENSPVIRAFSQGKVILQFLYRIDTLYLRYLRDVDKKSDEIEDQLHQSTKNSELIELLQLEKSLVYFTTALRSNEAVLEKLLRTALIKKYPEDAELLEDVIVENKQAIEMADIYSGILSGMMDAFASVISNNLNIVMKTLAIITIVMAIPTIIFSAYGMNVNADGMPFAENPLGFTIIVFMGILISIGVALLFRKAKMFK